MALIHAGCALKPSWTNNTTGSSITWNIINDSEHAPQFFTSVGLNGPFIELFYPTVKKICTFIVGVDETLQKYGVVAGATIGISSAKIQLSALYARAYFMTGNGTGWNSSPLVSSYNSATGSTTISGIPIMSNSYAYGTVGQYMGNNPYVVRPNLTSIANGQWKFDLLDVTTGLKVMTPPTSDDRVLITPPMMPTGVPVGSFDGDGYAKKIYEANTAPATSTGNLVVYALFEIED
jgi:hypothetical protein